MEAQVEWIENIVKSCMNTFESEDEKINCFIALEEKYRSFSFDTQKQIMKLMKEKFEIKDSIYIFSILIRYMDGREFHRSLMDCLILGEFDCNIGTILEYQTMAYVQGEYKRKRMFRRKIVDKFSEILVDTENTYIPLQKRKRKRIVIITGQILNILHAPSKIILNIAYVLQEELGYEICLFVCPCDSIWTDEYLWWNEPVSEMTLDEYRDKVMKISYRNTIFTGYQINMTESSWKEYHMMLSLVHEWNPMFVLNCDTTNPVVELVRNYTTLVSMRMSLECPISEGQILIRLGREENKKEIEYKEMLVKGQVQLFMKENFPVIIESGIERYTRLQLNLPEKDFLIAIVGNRLKKEFNMKFVSIMKQILVEVPDVSFAIIGENKGLIEYFKDEIFIDHVFFLGYCRDLIGVYGVLDLYLNLERKGGGFSSAMALIAGIPVVTLPDCDVAYNCGEEFIVRDYDEMFQIVCRYATDFYFYKLKKKYAQVYKEENTEKKLKRYVIDMMDGIISTIEKQEE